MLRDISYSVIVAASALITLITTITLPRLDLAIAPLVYWHAASTGLPSDVEALAAAPLSPAVLYAGTWGGGG